MLNRRGHESRRMRWEPRHDGADLESGIVDERVEERLGTQTERGRAESRGARPRVKWTRSQTRRNVVMHATTWVGRVRRQSGRRGECEASRIGNRSRR